MKQIALMGLMAAVVAVGIYGCSSGADTSGDSGNAGQDTSTGGDGYNPDGGIIDVGPACSPNCLASEMVTVPAGPFMMGCNRTVDTECHKDYEDPYHQVDVPAFKIDKYEVTIGEFLDCVNAGVCSHHFDDEQCIVPNGSNPPFGGILPEGFRGSSQPVVCVDWTQAQIFCQWLGKRLPTEAEWEKAARGTDGRIYPWGNDTLDCDRAVMSVPPCNSASTAPVGSKPLGASPYGVMDMIGNVGEWVEDDNRPLGG